MPFREGMERFSRNIIPDIRDNIPGRKELPTLEMTVDNTTASKRDAMQRKLLSDEQRQQLLASINDLKVNGSYEHLTLEGDKTNGTLHPHLFKIEKDEHAASFYFVDPEHNVGEQNLIRPKVSNLMAMRIPQESDASPEVAILRFSTDGIKPDELKLKSQLHAARQLLTQEGVPTMLADTRKNILFRIAALDKKVVLQARYTNPDEARDFLEGGKSSPAMQGKVDAQAAIVNRFVRLLHEHQFKPATRF